MQGGAPEETEVLARRIDLVDRLSEQPLHKADLVEESEYSRSTVNRAVKALEDAGLVERVTEGYVATQAGRLAANSYREFVDQQRSVMEATNVLSEVPHEWDLPIELPSEGRVESEDAGHKLFELFAERTRTAQSCRIGVPDLPDSRHLRLCHSRVVDGELTVTFHAPESVLAELAEEFPYLWAELEDAESFEARSGEAPPLEVVVWGDDEGPTAATLVGTGRDGITGYVDSEDPVGVGWARERLGSLDVDTDGGTEDVRSTEAAANLAPLTDGRLPSRLRSEGFVRVDDQYFDRREAMDPTTAWRVGLGIPEVAAGYAVDRTVGEWDDETDADSSGLTDDLVERLQSGEDVALIGPPGAGKSTTCKSVACRWHGSGRGPVFYRESGTRQSFESTAALEAAVERTEGTALVVVEDAVRSEANDVFEVMQAFEADDDAVFLVDARLRAFRREAVDTVTMPALVERDCERLIDQVESVTGDSLPVDAPDMLSNLRASDGDAAGAGIMPLLFHRLTQHLDPLERTEQASTLDEDVDRVRADLASIGETALDVGVLVTVLNAAGVGVYPAYVHALAAEEERTHRGVRRTLDTLEGEVLFPPGDDGAPYRGTHETWSARFLERLLADEGEAAAQRRFGRVLTAFLDLADSPDRRQAVAAAVPDDREALAPVVTDPVGWAERTVSATFAVGRRYPKLAALFGTSEQSYVTVPSACPEPTAARCAEWRGWMYARDGDLDRADAEFRQIETAAETLTDDDADSARLNSLLGRTMTARQRGDVEGSGELARDAVELASELGDRGREAEALRALGIANGMQGEMDRSEDQHERSLVIAEEIGDDYGRANALNNLGAVSIRKGDLESAQNYLQESLDVVRDAGDRRDAADRLMNLALVARKQGNLETAEKHSRNTLEIYREVGDRTKQPVPLGNLGQASLVRGEFEAARDYFAEASEIADEVDDRHVEATSLGFLGVVEYRLGAFEAAETHLEESLQGLAETSDDRRRAQGHNRLGYVALARGDDGVAEDHFETARDLFAENDDPRGRARSLSNLGELAAVRGELETARGRLEESLDVEREAADPDKLAETLERLGTVRYRLGDTREAIDHLEESVEIGREADNRHRTALSRGILGAVLVAEGDVDAGAVPDELRVLRRHLDVEADLENDDRVATLCDRASDRDVGVRYLDGIEAICGGREAETTSSDERASL